MNCKYSLIILLCMFFTGTSKGQELNVAVLKAKINSHPNHDLNLSKELAYYLDTCSIKNKFNKEEFLQFVSDTDTKTPLSLLNIDMTSGSKTSILYLSSTTIGWYDSTDKYDLFLTEQINKYLLFTKTRKEKTLQKPFNLEFGYFIFEKDKTIYCLLRIVEI
jgi:hypothetical protein